MNPSTSFDAQYWTNRYHQGATQWDLGQPSPPLMQYAEGLPRKDVRMLIPGGGNSYEAEQLHRQGFTQVYVVDIAREPLDALLRRCPDFPEAHLLHQDFFELDHTFDVILEQTFFCALDPQLRAAYVQKMHDLLHPGGRLAGVLFEDKLFTEHPPFGGFRDDYRPLFQDRFRFHKFETCYNSVKPRAGRELWIELEPIPA